MQLTIIIMPEILVEFHENIVEDGCFHEISVAVDTQLLYNPFLAHIFIQGITYSVILIKV